MNQELLWTPFRFANGVESPNRLWLAPMTNTQSHADGTLSEDELRWLKARAEGGFGVIESCATHVCEDGQGWEGQWGICDDAQVAGWARAATSMHDSGASLLAQLFHAGARARRAEGRVPLSAVAEGEPGGDDEVRAATGEDLERIIEGFARGAERAAEAGVDGVELHGAHGYLLCQFLQASNTRSDGWGGELEGRARLIRTVMREVRRRVPAEFVVGVRLSPESHRWLPGLDLDESVQTAQWLCEEGADFIHLSLWNVAPNTQKRPDEHAVGVFREALPGDVPIVTAGRIWTRADALGQIERGAAAVALGRAAITTPDWPRRVVLEGGDALRPPVTPAQLRQCALSERFIDYMRGFSGFVAQE